VDRLDLIPQPGYRSGLLSPLFSLANFFSPAAFCRSGFLMERPAMIFLCRGAIYGAVFLFLLLVRFPANAQQGVPADAQQGLSTNPRQGLPPSAQQRLPSFIRDLAAAGVPINQLQPPANATTLPQNSDPSNPSDPNHIFDQTGSKPAANPTAAGVLVLKSGRALRGSIHADSRGYFVESRRSTLYFPFSHVKFVASDLHEAYTKLCDSVGGSSAHRDLILARWCLENDLRPEAAEHFQNVLTYEPNNREARQALARLDESRLEEPANDRDTKSTTGSSNSQFPESLSRLSGSAVREFVIGIQPILLARCGNVKCHGAGDPKATSPTSFHLEHVRLSQSGNRAATARNLEAVLKLLDGQFPSQSAFFQKGLQPHGGMAMRSPMDGPAGRAQEMRLRRWVDSIAPERNRLTREQASRDFIGRFSRSKNPPTLRDPNVVPAGATMGNPSNGAVQPERLTPPSDMTSGFQTPGDSLKRMGPQTDPFDPAQFNSQNPH
jgi:hypothetical protein